MLTGALCGAAVLSKGYGMVTAAVVVGTVALSALAHVLREAVAASNHKRRERKARDAATPTTERLTPVRRWKALALVMVAAVAVGIWPSVRNLGWCGRPLVDNFDIWPGRMEAQPPGSVGAIEWASFRLPALLRRPWVHMTQVNSFWTELYGRLWFEYEGIVVSLRNSPEWAALRSRVQAQTGNWASKEGWRRMLSWEPGDTPTGLRRVAVASYLAGLPLTAIVLGGLVVAVRRMWTFAPALLVLHFAGCLFVPIYQTVRLPHFAAMKPVFALGALSSAPVFAVLFFGVLPRRARAVALVVACAAAVTLVIANVGYIVELGRQ